MIASVNKQFRRVVVVCSGADVNAQTEETQETALTLACCGGFLEIAELLINSGANLELGCSTPLMEAAQEGHVDLVKFLIASGRLRKQLLPLLVWLGFSGFVKLFYWVEL